MIMDNNDTQKQTRWFDLMVLTRLCPSQVPAVKAKQAKNKQVELTPDTGMVAVTGNTRLLLFAFVQRADGFTDETWVARRTLLNDTQMSLNTLDAAISNLKRAGLLRIRKEFDETKVSFRHIWIVQRARLKELVGDEISEELIAKVVKAAIEDGQSSLNCSPARVEQTKSALWKAAGSTHLDIKEWIIKEKVVMLSVAVPPKIKTEVSEEEAPSPTQSSNLLDSLPEHVRKRVISNIHELRSRARSQVSFEVDPAQGPLVKEIIESELAGADVGLSLPFDGEVTVSVNWPPAKKSAA
jgi:hypothetical protein